MAVCNIFKPLEKTTGTFLLFSQYSEDLIREAVQSEYYRVIPSKFIALDIDYSNETNDSVSKYLLDSFENGCAVCRKEMNNEWTPKHSYNLFWESMFGGNKWITVSGKDNIIEQVRYVGDINMQSYNEYNGMGYSEVFCYIPTDSKQYNYVSEIDPKEVEKIGKEFNSKSYIEGYKKGEVIINSKEYPDWGEISSDKEYKYYPQNDIYRFSWSGGNGNVLSKPLDIEKYNINTIILLYDIETKSDGHTRLYGNIPMGIYFTGVINDGEMTNKVVKYVSNLDIYGSGTSYGLKICSRFSVTPNNSVSPIKEIDVTAQRTNEPLLSQLLTEMSKSQSKMDDLITGMQENIQDKKDFLATFKNSRINVPYIKKVGDKQYWFVNGRCIGEMGYSNQTPCTKPDHITNDNLTVSLTIEDEYGNTSFDRSDLQNEYYVYLYWTVRLNGEETKNSLVSLSIEGNGINVHADNVATPYKAPAVGSDTLFTVTAIKDNMKAMSSIMLPVYWPMFFGAISNDANPSSPTEEDIKLANASNSLKKIIQSNKSTSQTYTANMGEYTNPELNSYNGYLTFAYPFEFGKLTHIYDKTGFDYIDDFYCTIIDINFENSNKPITYYVYTEKNKASVENFTLQFV